MEHDWPWRSQRDGDLAAVLRDHTCTEEFLRLYARHGHDVQAYILSLVPHWADAEDIFQETSVRLFQQSEQWTADQDFRAWACTVAYYQVLTYRKHSQREKARFSPTFVDLVARQNDVEAEQSDARRTALMECLGKLDAAARRLLDLAYRGDLSIQQVAKEVGRSPGATYKSLSRMRHVLRECVERSAVRREEET